MNLAFWSLKAMSEFFGISAALLTPFNDDGSINYKMMAEHAHHVLANGCTSVTLFGTTGEGTSHNLDERIKAVSFLEGAGIDADRIIFGIKADAITQAANEIKAGLGLGCNSFLLAPPHYFKGVSDNAVFAWYERVLADFAERDLRIILYNIPQLTGVKISSKVAMQLYKHFPGLIYGVKDSSGDWDSALDFLTLKDDLAILIGDERLLADGVRLGAMGSISGMANLFSRQLSEIAIAKQQDASIVAIADAIKSLPVIAALKLLAARMYDNRQWLDIRPPLERLETSLEEKLLRDYDRIFGQ